MLMQKPLTAVTSRSSSLSDFAVHCRLVLFDWAIFCGLVLLVFATRQAFAGPVYFVDGPLLVYSIRLKWFVIQSPGYWLYAHLGGLFNDPAEGLAFWTKLFSALGGGAFFVLCRLLGKSWPIATLAALTYSFGFHIWFSGEIHSSYAAEILFPILTLCCFLKLQQRRTVSWSVLVALSSGLAIALRPSDGIFLLPLWVYLLWRERYHWKILSTYAGVSLLVFAIWYLPTRHALQQHAMRQAGFYDTQSQLLFCLRSMSVFVVGITPHSLANMVRVYLPLLLAYWAVLPLLFLQRGKSLNSILALWTVPGLLFFTFGYMADPTYLVYLSGAFVLAALLQAHHKAAVACLTICLLWNTSLFLSAAPSQSKTLYGKAWNVYVTKYCAYGVKHQWTATMRQTVSGDGI